MGGKTFRGKEVKSDRIEDGIGSHGLELDMKILKYVN